MLSQLFLENKAENIFTNMDTVTSKIWSRSRYKKISYAFPWCICMLHMVRPCQLFLEIPSRNRFFTNIAPVTLQVMSRSPYTNFVCACPWCTFIPNMVRQGQSNLKISSRNRVSERWSPWPLKWGQGHHIQTLYLPCNGALVCQIWYGYVNYLSRYWAESNKYDSHDIRNKCQRSPYSMGFSKSFHDTFVCQIWQGWVN